MRLKLFLFLFCAAPLSAQTTVDSLRSRIEVLEQMLGLKYLGMSSGELRDSLNPNNTLPGGRYPYMLSDYQIRVGLAEGFDGQQAQITGALQRIAALEGNSGNNPGVLTVTKLRANKICLGDLDCRADVSAALQIRGLHDAEIGLMSNESLTNPQGAFAHGSTVSLSGDGGLRLIHNNLHGRDANGNWVLIWNTPSRPRSIWGFDSQGTLSFSQDFNGVIEPSQLFILRNDRANKIAAWTLMPAGYRWGIGSSSCLNCFDKLYLPPQQ